MKKQWVLAVVLCLALLTVIQQLTTTNKQLPKKATQPQPSRSQL